jgi:hypothetical protein
MRACIASSAAVVRNQPSRPSIAAMKASEMINALAAKCRLRNSLTRCPDAVVGKKALVTVCASAARAKAEPRLNSE